MDVDILPCSHRLCAYGGNELPFCGMFNTAFQLNQTTVEDEVIVVRGTGEFLLGKTTAVALNALVLPEVNTVCFSAEQLREKIPTVLHGVGKVNGYQARLHVNLEVPTVAQRQRRILYAYVQAVDKKLEELLSTDVIEETDGQTPWVSPVVIALKKNGDIRLCVDLRRVNEAITGERHTLPAKDEILHEANGSTLSTVFSKIDLRWGFHQVELEKSSRHLTTFVANDKLYRYKRLPFRISSAPELNQKIIRDVIRDLPGVVNAAC